MSGGALVITHRLEILIIKPLCAKIFDQMDKDGDGNISIKEAVEAMRGAWQQDEFIMLTSPKIDMSQMV